MPSSDTPSLRGTTGTAPTTGAAAPATGSSSAPMPPLRWELSDLVFQIYLGVVVILLVVLGAIGGRIADPWPLVGLHLGLAAAGLAARQLPRIWDHSATRFIRWWYPLILLYPCFKSIHWMTGLFWDQLLDPTVYGYEVGIFGVEMTVLLQRLARPWLTELMYFCYVSYYFFVPLAGIPLFVRGRRDLQGPAGAPMREFIFALSLTFYVCFLHFLVTPVGGPIFWADHPGPLLELTGGPITRIEQWIFHQGGIVGGAMPSSHVAVAFAATIYAVRFRAFAWLLVPLFPGLAMSTMYCAYHYGVDVLQGLLVGGVCALVATRLFRPGATPSRSRDGLLP